jgi:hypothetical protein
VGGNGTVIATTFLIRDQKLVLFFEAGHDPFDGLFELSHPHLSLFSSNRQQGGFVYQIRKISPHHAGSHAG